MLNKMLLLVPHYSEYQFIIAGVTTLDINFITTLLEIKMLNYFSTTQIV